ncbi:DedA family protein [Hoeflea ulvae]|uniref:VTT domain-containing protein n=1 Tax=Hoeflea ulvae TaxID=2983764 RepID=A0ABT3YHP0_9HYPH|nr:VTT domain-containing protein [Hoeflea ulvae]MCY0095413.1 VTT domain-containing protein [Hoeflea ulvae]
MTGQVLDYLALYGVPAAAFLLAIGQFGVPLPTSLALLTIGALAANDDADLFTAFAWALTGATLGDQAGFLAGRFVIRSAGDRRGFLGGLARKAQAAEPRMAKWGISGVFFSRWLLTPLGPAFNIASGVIGLPWPAFSLSALAGECLWVCIYIGLGFTFGSNIEMLAGILGNLSMALVMLTLAAFLGWRLLKAVRKLQKRPNRTRPS